MKPSNQNINLVCCKECDDAVDPRRVCALIFLVTIKQHASRGCTHAKDLFLRTSMLHACSPALYACGRFQFLQDLTTICNANWHGKRPKTPVKPRLRPMFRFLSLPAEPDQTIPINSGAAFSCCKLCRLACDIGVINTVHPPLSYVILAKMVRAECLHLLVCSCVLCDEHSRDGAPAGIGSCCKASSANALCLVVV